MSKIQTIEEKQLAAEVYAQRLAYISVTGKEPDVNDTITYSGYLNCWNEAIAAVGDPFTDSGQVLLAKLQAKAVFHGEKILYHRSFPAFFFRVLHITFIKNASSDELSPWQELDFNHELPCPPSGVINWLEACLHDQNGDFDDEIGRRYFTEMLTYHVGASTQIINICSDWAESLDKQELDFTLSEEVSTSISQMMERRQAVARLTVERKVYQKLFFTDPGEWSVDNYLNGISRVLFNSYGHSDLLEVRLWERFPLEYGWGFTYDINGGKAISIAEKYAPYGDDMERLIGNDLLTDYDIGDIDREVIINYLYHPDFLPIFLSKIGVKEKDIVLCWPTGMRWLDVDLADGWHAKAGAPSRVENTAHWMGLTYKHLLLEDWQHFLSILNAAAEVKTSWWDVEYDKETQERTVVNYSDKIRKRYPTLQRAIDYAKFKVATMPTKGQPILPISTAPKQLAASVQDDQNTVVRIENSGIESALTPTEIAELGYALLKSGKVTATNQAEFVRALARFLGQGELATAPEKTLGKLLDRNDPTRLLDILKQGLEEYAQAKAARK